MRLLHNLSEENSYFCSKNFSYLSHFEKTDARLFRTNCFVDDTVCPAAAALLLEKEIFLLNFFSKTKLVELNSGQRWAGGSQNTEMRSKKFWVNAALFISSFCCMRRLLHSSLKSEYPSLGGLEWEFDAKSKDQTDKCHFHHLQKKLLKKKYSYQTKSSLLAFSSSHFIWIEQMSADYGVMHYAGVCGLFCCCDFAWAFWKYRLAPCVLPYKFYASLGID